MKNKSQIMQQKADHPKSIPFLKLEYISVLIKTKLWL